MKKISNWWLLLLLPILLIAGFVFFIWFFSYDHTGKITTAILYDKSRLNKPVIDAALAARFAKGSNAAELEFFVEKLDGKCEKIKTDKMVCKLFTNAMPCVSNWIEISATMSLDAKIQQISAKNEGIAC